MVNRLCVKLKKAGLINQVMRDQDNNGIAPAVEPEELTVGFIFNKIENEGNSNYIPRFKETYEKTIQILDSWFAKCYKDLADIPLNEIPLPDTKIAESWKYAQKHTFSKQSLEVLWIYL